MGRKNAKSDPRLRLAAHLTWNAADAAGKGRVLGDAFRLGAPPTRTRSMAETERWSASSACIVGAALADRGCSSIPSWSRRLKELS
jgi:hypothetical protein